MCNGKLETTIQKNEQTRTLQKEPSPDQGPYYEADETSIRPAVTRTSGEAAVWQL